MKLSGRHLISLILILFLISIFSFFNSCKKESEKVFKVRIDSITNISVTTASAVATVLDMGQGIDQHGHCWSTNTEPDYENNENKTENGAISQPDSYISNLTELKPNTNYYVIAYVKKGNEFAYSENVLSFTTLHGGLPVVSIGIAENITTSDATVTGIIESLGTGSSSVSDHGHCWSNTTTTPTVSNDKTSLGSRDSTGSFTSSLVGLTPGTKYIIRAYATNDQGTTYSDTMNILTLPITELPTVETASVSSITATSATSGGSILSDGGASITSKGVCWNTNSNPTISDNHTEDGTGSDPFISEITGLNSNTTYYVRAYATNSEGTAFGSQVSFSTLEDLFIPLVTTTAISNITDTTAVSGGNVTSNGGDAVTARGVCWNTTGTPTISDDYTTDGSGTGSFTSNITGLNAYTTYYVRAYATNSVGTAYGDQIKFTTLEEINLPEVTTTAITDITTTTAVSGGNVTSDGGAEVAAKGVCWNTTSSPTISDDHTTDGFGTGIFISNLTSLEDNTTYYVRAYATNSVGTAYGQEVSFTTSEEYLIAHYTLNNTSMDITGNCSDMILENISYVGNSIYCNGIYRYGPNPVDYSDAYTDEISAISYDELTISVEFQIIDTPQYNYPVLVAGSGVEHDRWLGFAVHSDRKIALHANNFSEQARSTEEYLVNTWYEARITYDGNIDRGNLYIDGNLVCSADFTFNLSYAHKSVGITNYASGAIFKGYLRNLKIYSTIVEP